MARIKKEAREKKIVLGNALFAYHRTWKNNTKFEDFYFTDKKNPRIGDNVYVISSNKPKHPEYFLEGLYVVDDIKEGKIKKRKLLMMPLIQPSNSICLSYEKWFDNDKFRNRFAFGASMARFPLVYENRFYKLLVENKRTGTGREEFDSEEDALRGHEKRRWGGSGNIERKILVEQAAVETVRKHFSEGYTIKSVESDNVGWDLEATPTDGGATICLEVKGLFGTDMKTGLTPNEYRTLDSHKNGSKPHYRFCVSTNALSDGPTLRILSYDQAAGLWFDEVSHKQSRIKIHLVQSAIISQEPEG